MDSLWHKAVLIRPSRIAGIELKPFSSWHMLCLEQLDSPFINGETSELEAGDIITFLLVCSQGFADQGQALVDFYNSRWIRVRWWLKIFFMNFGRVCHEIIQYRDGQGEQPDFWRKEGDTLRNSGVPGSFLSPATLMMQYGMREAVAWDMAWSKAHCYKAVYLETEGANIQGGERPMSVEKIEATLHQMGMAADGGADGL